MATGYDELRDKELFLHAEEERVRLGVSSNILLSETVCGTIFLAEFTVEGLQNKVERFGMKSVVTHSFLETRFLN